MLTDGIHRLRTVPRRFQLTQYPPLRCFERVQDGELAGRAAEQFSLFDFGIAFRRGHRGGLVEGREDVDISALPVRCEFVEEIGQGAGPSEIGQCSAGAVQTGQHLGA